VQSLRAKLGGFALFFYNDLCPDVLAVVWRPLFQPRAFSAVTSEYVRPVSEDWQSDTMVTLSVGDILRGMACLTSDIVIDVKVFDNGPTIEPSTRGKRKHAEVVDDEGSDDDSES
jgi:Nrap protein domain 6